MRDRLIELLTTDVECTKDGHGDCSMCEYQCADDKCTKYLSKIIADFLLASGVIVSPCKMGRMTFLSKINYKQYTHRPAPLLGGAVMK